MFDNDNELIYLIKEGNEEAVNILYNKYKPLIISRASKMLPYISKRGIEISDLVQEGMLALDEAIKSYKVEENVLFYTYALKCIDYKIKTALRNSNVLKNKILNESISLDNDDEKDLLNYIVKENSNPEYDMLSLEHLEELNLKIKEKLTNLESKIYELKINGATNEEISKILEIDLKTVYNALYRIKDKIKGMYH